MNLIGTDEAIKAEESVLGAIFIDQNSLDEITFLEPRDFLSETHEQIFKVMKFLQESNKPIDVVTVTNEYVKFGRIEEIGGVTYFMQLAESCPTAANIKHYANIVRSKAIRRRGVAAAKDIESLSRSDFSTDEEYFSSVENLVSGLRPKDNGKMLNFSESRQEYFDHLKQKAEFIPTKFPKFDQWSSGLARGDLFITAGRPSAGKTAILLQRCYNVASRPGAGSVLIFSQEMKRNKIKDRMISFLCGISSKKIRNKTYTDEEKLLIEEAYEIYETLPIFIQDSPGVTIEEVKATARQFKRRYGKIDVIAVDYLQIMEIPITKGERSDQAIGRVTRTAKHIANEMNCCFIMLSQMSRGSEKAGQLKPKMSDLKDSGSIEADADVVEFLWFDTDDKAGAGIVVQQFFAKGRDIGINDFRLLFKNWIMRFDELEDKKE